MRKAVVHVITDRYRADHAFHAADVICVSVRSDGYVYGGDSVFLQQGHDVNTTPCVNQGDFALWGPDYGGIALTYIQEYQLEGR